MLSPEDAPRPVYIYSNELETYSSILPANLGRVGVLERAKGLGDVLTFKFRSCFA